MSTPKKKTGPHQVLTKEFIYKIVLLEVVGFSLILPAVSSTGEIPSTTPVTLGQATLSSDCITTIQASFVSIGLGVTTTKVLHGTYFVTMTVVTDDAVAYDTQDFAIKAVNATTIPTCNTQTSAFGGITTCTSKVDSQEQSSGSIVGANFQTTTLSCLIIAPTFTSITVFGLSFCTLAACSIDFASGLNSRMIIFEQ